MSKASSILVCPVVPLHRIPPQEVDVIRRFLFQHIRGMDRENDLRWKRLWGQLWNASAGEGFELLRTEERGGPFHRRHRAILQRLFDSQERFRNVARLHDWIKLGAGFVEWKDGKPKPRSTSFDVCSEDEMREFHGEAVDYLRTERAQRFLWRHLKPHARTEMLESVLRNPNDQGEEHP